MAAAREPALADAISQAIGDNWIVDHGQLRGLRPLAADARSAASS